MSVLTMVHARLGDYDLQLRWTGAAMLEWNEQEGHEVSINDPEGIAAMLHLMAREAAAFCRHYGYPPLDPPPLEELKEYFRFAEIHELQYAISCLNAALEHSNERDYTPEDGVDIDTLELKKTKRNGRPG